MFPPRCDKDHAPVARTASGELARFLLAVGISKAGAQRASVVWCQSRGVVAAVLQEAGLPILVPRPRRRRRLRRVPRLRLHSDIESGPEVVFQPRRLPPRLIVDLPPIDAAEPWRRMSTIEEEAAVAVRALAAARHQQSDCPRHWTDKGMVL